MPVVDGYEATRRIRAAPVAKVRNIKIIALTASAIRGDKERCLGASAPFCAASGCSETKHFRGRYGQLSFKGRLLSQLSMLMV